MKNMFSALTEEQENHTSMDVVSMDTSSVMEEFPELLIPSVGKKKKLTFIVSSSLIEELKGKKDKIFAERTEAFETLEDKQSIEKRLTRTKMCKYIKAEVACPHGAGCRFAHSADELEVAECAFGNVCKLTRLVNGVYVNGNRRRICKFKHVGETKEAFFTRTKMTPKKPVVEEVIVEEPDAIPERIPEVSKPTAKPVAEAIVTEAVVDDWMQLVDTPVIDAPKSALSRLSRGAKARESEKLCDAILGGKTKVIRVYRELATEAFQMMIDSGMQHLRLEII
jgi:hypothetical protein